MMKKSAKELVRGMERFSKRIEAKKKLYLKIAGIAKKDKSGEKLFRIKEKGLLHEILNCFGTAVDHKKAKEDLCDIFEAALHKETGALIICNRGATLYALSPRAHTPCIIRHIGFCVYMPGIGVEFVNVGLVGDVYNGNVILRSESACTPSFLFGSQRCNCHHQWESVRELAAEFNRINPPKHNNGADFEKWVQAQFEYKNGKHIAKNKGPGFVLMHIDTQNGMGSGYTRGEFAFDLFTRASMRHRGEYSSEQIKGTTMFGGFEAIGITPDPRRENHKAGYKITFTILDYLGVSKNIIFLTNNHLKMSHLKHNGYNISRVKSLGAVNLAGAQEAEQRGAEFGHMDITGECITFEEELKRLRRDISQLVTGY